MMPAGQYISPQMLQALQSISSSNEDQSNLKQQMALAQQLRQPVPPSNEMAGKVAVRQSPLAYLSSGLSNYMSQQKENQTMQQMQAQAKNLRDVRGKYMSLLAANQNPGSVHPDSLAALPASQDGSLNAANEMVPEDNWQ